MLSKPVTNQHNLPHNSVSNMEGVKPVWPWGVSKSAGALPPTVPVRHNQSWKVEENYFSWNRIELMTD